MDTQENKKQKRIEDGEKKQLQVSTNNLYQEIDT